jgi:hypothetical protein
MRRFVIVALLAVVLVLALAGVASAAPKTDPNLGAGTYTLQVVDMVSGKVLSTSTRPEAGGIQPMSSGSSGWLHPAHSADSTYGSGGQRSSIGYGVTYKNALGIKCWTWWNTPTWWWNGSTVQHTSISRQGSIHLPGGVFWQYDGLLDQGSDGGAGYTYWYQWQQGQFSYHGGQGYGVTKSPWVGFTADYNGGILFNWTN